MFGLEKGVLVLVDRQTDSLWTHLDGEATAGRVKGARMAIIPLVHTPWQEWRRLNPDTDVLSNDTPFSYRYRDVGIGLPDPGMARQLQYLDNRLKAEELVLGVMVGDAFAAYPLTALRAAGGVLNDTVGGQPIIVFYDDGARSAIAFSRRVRGQETRFAAVAGARFQVRDDATGTTWDFAGRAVAGELSGAALEFVTSYISEWYGWSAYHPTTSLYGSRP